MIASSKKKFVIALDTALLIIFILLLSPRMTGLALHVGQLNLLLREETGRAADWIANAAEHL